MLRKDTNTLTGGEEELVSYTEYFTIFYIINGTNPGFYFDRTLTPSSSPNQLKGNQLQVWSSTEHFTPELFGPGMGFFPALAGRKSHGTSGADQTSESLVSICLQVNPDPVCYQCEYK